IDNLIAWGDQLFTQDSWESITAAYLLYVYAYDLLGEKPQEVGECPGTDEVLDFDQIKKAYPHGIPQFLIDLEHFIGSTDDGPDLPVLGHAFNDLNAYFCVPENLEFLQRWDTVQDRLYKINHSMNIEGVVRTLPLFQPPMNPLDLVKAAAAGNHVQPTATAEPQLSPFRFAASLATARALCATLVELGHSLLSALEKKDAEALSALRLHQEGQILSMITQVKEDRIQELEATVQALTDNQHGAEIRHGHYSKLIDDGLSDFEVTSLEAGAVALAFNILGSATKTAAAIGYAIPQAGSPFAMTYGGKQIGSALNAAAGVFEIGSEISTYASQLASTMGGYQRRDQEWKLQRDVAKAEVDGLAHHV
ncbi:MAG: hypothetical protein MI919_09985, partial [Holophagales bacterium]|nr:hypothetical protein [Holophagales bacterium]